MKMQTRFLSPSFFYSERLAAFPPLVRLFYQGLWCVSDKEGRIEDRPRRLKAMLLPYDDFDPDEALQLLSTPSGGKPPFLLRYRVDEVPYIYITAWEEHGRPYTNETPSKIPPPDLTVPNLSLFPTLKQPCGQVSGSLPPSLGIKNKELRIRNKELRIKNRKNEKTVFSEAFLLFWAAYPNKKAKQKASEFWNRLDLDAQIEPILAAVERERASPQWTKDGGQYIPHPSTWLYQRRFEDEGIDPKQLQEKDWKSEFIAEMKGKGYQ